MWSFEDSWRRQGRPLDSKPSTLREYSHSPPRTPREPTHTPHGFLVHGTPGAHDSDSYFSLPVTSTTSGSENAPTASQDARTARPCTDSAVPDPPVVDANVLELWTALEKSVKNNDERSSLVAEPASPAETPVTADTAAKLTVPKIPIQNADVPSAIISSASTSPTSDPLHSNRLPPARSRSNSASKKTHNQDASDPTKSMFSNAKASSMQFLQDLLDSSKVDIVNEDTGEIYIRGVSLNMLKYFCGGSTINALLFSKTIRIPPTHASSDGIIRVVRYMRRCCQGLSRRPTGELRTPPSIKEGIATSLACRFFYLDADGDHLEKLVAQDFMGSPRFFITDEDVVLIWCGYKGTLRDTPFADALVWFVLEHVMSGTHALADEVRWLLEQEEFEELKARVRCELKKAEWRGVGRKAFLERCQRDRGNKSVIGGRETPQEGKE